MNIPHTERRHGGQNELSRLATWISWRTADRGCSRASRLHLPLRHRRRRIPGSNRASRVFTQRFGAARVRTASFQVLRAAHRSSWRGDRRGHLVHDRIGQPGSDFFAHSHVRLGMGDRMGLLLRRDRCRSHLRLPLGHPGPANSSHRRLDLLRRCLGEPGGDQRHYHLHAHARTLARNRQLLGRLLQSHLLAVVVHSYRNGSGSCGYLRASDRDVGTFSFAGTRRALGGLVASAGNCISASS